MENIKLESELKDLNLEMDYIVAWKYYNKYIVGYKDKVILVVKPDEKRERHWNMKYPVIEEVDGLELIYLDGW